MSVRPASPRGAPAPAAPEPDRACPLCQSRSNRLLDAYSLDPWRIVRCDDCGFVFLLNPPEYVELEDDFAWEKTSVTEVARRKKTRPIVWWLDQKTRWRLHMFRPSRQDFYRRLFKPGRVLDVGCGDSSGPPDPFVPFGIEISQALFAGASAKMAARGGKAVFGPAAEAITEFPDDYFTGIVMSSVVEHEKQPKKLLENVSRVLTDAGVAYIRVPNFGGVNRAVMGAKWCGFRYPDHVNYFTIGTLQQMAAECGLRLRLLNWLRAPFDDNINAVLQKTTSN